MGLKEAFASLLRMGQPKRQPSPDPVSIVMLLREPRFPTLEQIRESAARAYGMNFSDNRNSRHSVYVLGVIFTLANVGPHRLSFLFMTKSYADNSELAREFEKNLPRSDQRQAWSEHKAYMAIDYVKGDVDEDSQYAVLAKLCSELYSANCRGIYLPKENALVPDEGNPRKELGEFIGYREVDVN